MTARRFLLFVVGAALCTGYCGLAGLRRLAELTGSAPRPAPAPQASTRDALREFTRESSGDEERVTYGFVDYESRERRVTCFISRAAHEHEMETYGLRQAEIDREWSRRVLAQLERRVAARGFSDLVQVRAQGGGFAWTVSACPEQDRILAEMSRLADEVVDGEGQAIKAELLRGQGFLLEGRQVYIDHAGLAERASPVLSDCFHALERSGTGYNARQYLGLFVAFLQEIRYEVPPREQGGREICGLYVPSEVLLGDHGDCDSKSVTFAALWRQFRSPVLVIELPEHVLVGVPLPPGPDDHSVRVGLRDYVLCEVAGPGKLRPGAKTRLSGNVRYVVVGSL